MKKFITFLLCLGLIVSASSLALSSFINDSKNDVLKSFFVSKSIIETQYEETVKTIEYLVPVEYQEEFTKALDTVPFASHAEALIEAYSQEIFHDLTSGDAPQFNIDEEIDLFLDQYSDELDLTLTKDVPSELKDAFITEIKTKINYETHYKTLITKVQNQMNKDQLELIEDTGYLINQSEALSKTSAIGLLVLIVAIAILNIRNRKGFKASGISLIIASIVVLVGSFIVPIVAQPVLQRLPIALSTDVLSFETLTRFSLIFFVGGVVLIIAQSVVQKKSGITLEEY